MNNYKFRNENLGELYEKYASKKLKKCIACGKTSFKKWAQSGPYKAYKCNNCNLVFMNPQLNEDGLTDYYSNYIGKRRLSNTLKMKQRSIQYVQDANLIKSFIKKGKILDVGCNGGFFLDEMGSQFTRFGTELDSSAVQYAKSNYGEFASNIYNGSLSKAKFENDSFDLVMMRGVIEHVPDPEESINEVSRILKPGGLFYICATPNGESFCADLYRENWTLYHPVQHLWHFSPNNLSILCSKSNLSLEWKDFPYLNTPYENVRVDAKKIAQKIINNNDENISPPFFENMMSLVFKKNSK